MRPFNLEKAKAGNPIVDLDGSPVKFIAHVPDATYPADRVVYLNSGGYICTCSESCSKLRMAPEIKEMWVLIYDDGTNHITSCVKQSHAEICAVRASVEKTLPFSRVLKVFSIFIED